LLVTLTIHLSVQLLTASLPLYAVGLGADDAALGILAGSGAVFALLSRLWAGQWIDRRGAKPVYVAGMLVSTVCAVGYWIASSVTTLVAFRMLSGLSIGLFATAGQTLAIHVTPRERWGWALTLYSIGYPLAQIIGPPTGIVIARLAGYPWLFAVCVGVSIAAVLMSLRLASGGMVATRGPIRLLQTAVFAPGLLLLSLSVAFGANFGLLAIHASRRGLGNPGTAFAAQSLAALALLLIMSRYSDRISRMSLIIPGLLLSALGMWTTAVASGWLLLPGAMGVGVGHALALPTLHALAAEMVPPDARGGAIATLGVLMELGVVIGAVGGGFLSRALGTPVMFGLAGVAPLIGAAFAFVSRHRAVSKVG
jgi:MFS family permease